MEGQQHFGVLKENIKSWENKNYYERLGVSPSATEEEIRKAFRKEILKQKNHWSVVSLEKDY